MKNNLDDWDNIFDFPNIEDYTDSILFKSYFVQGQDAKKELKLNKEIKKKKHQISNMFNMKFGKNFLNQKPESLKIFEKRLAKYLFDPDSKFLSKFPKLQRRLRHEKKISEELLKQKIDIGSMVFFDLNGKNARKTRNINNGKEKILSISKNFSSTPIKDVVGNSYYKTKFWSKYSKNLKAFYRTKITESKENYIEEHEEFSKNNLVVDGEDNNSIKDLIIKDPNTQREKMKIRLNSISNVSNRKSSKINTNIKNNTITNTISNINSNTKSNTLNNNNNSISIRNNITLKHNTKIGKNKSVIFNIDKLEPSSLDIKSNDSNSNSLGLKLSKVRRNSVCQGIEKNENEKFITSYTSDFRKFDNLIPKLSPHNYLSRNQDNKSSLLAISNTNTKNNNIYNIKANSKNFLYTTRDFYNKKLINKNMLKTFSGYKNNSSHKYSPRFFLKKNEDALKKKNLKFKTKLNTQIVKLNHYNNKCNNELIKIIDGNNDDNYKERKMNIINKTKLDIKEILVGKKNNLDKKDKNEPPIPDKVKDTIKSLIKVAIYDVGDNFGELDPKKKEKILKKGINRISDEQALKMIDNMVDKEKELDIRKIIGNNDKSQKKSKNHMKLIRIKAKNNYKRMLKLKNMILIDKGKIFKTNTQDLDSPQK